MSVARSILAPLLWMTPGAFSLARLLGPGYGLRCVLFHHVEDESSVFTRGLDVGISEERFERLIKFISSHYSPVDLETVIAAGERGHLRDLESIVLFLRLQCA
jgi:hypothetical protein